jgi:CxxC motif-containing protein (DUF1111 family)
MARPLSSVRALTLAGLALAIPVSALPGGVAADGASVYAQPAPGMAAAERLRFDAGRRLFAQHWTVAPSAFGQWGRGPLSNADACTDCHAGNGRGRPPLAPEEAVQSGIVRLSLREAPGAPHPVYGEQLQPQGVLGKVPGEGDAYVDWIEHEVAHADGVFVPLRSPRLRFAALAYGPLGAETLASLRIAPPLVGPGLLERVPAAVLEQISQSQAPAVRGRVARTGVGVGRFGHKALHPSLREQIAAALHFDIGVTSGLFPQEDCTAHQPGCRAFPVPPAPEITEDQLEALVAYLRDAAPPAARAYSAEARRGAALFGAVGCVACHAPELPLEDGRTIRPYSDLLLHDLGTGLADGRPEGAASGSEWRTPPLWGLGLSARVNGNAFLLHDGRARNAEEAILWHGGQAQAARDAFRQLPAPDREALLAFLAAL